MEAVLQNRRRVKAALEPQHKWTSELWLEKKGWEHDPMSASTTDVGVQNQTSHHFLNTWFPCIRSHTASTTTYSRALRIVPRTEGTIWQPKSKHYWNKWCFLLVDTTRLICLLSYFWVKLHRMAMAKINKLTVGGVENVGLQHFANQPRWVGVRTCSSVTFSPDQSTASEMNRACCDWALT